MQIIKIKAFHRWSKKIKLSDSKLLESVYGLLQGHFETSLGGNIFKQRIAINNRGKRGGTRVIVAYKKDFDVFFIYGFEKNDRANVSNKELEGLKQLAEVYFSFNPDQIREAIKKKEFFEVKYEEGYFGSCS